MLATRFAALFLFTLTTLTACTRGMSAPQPTLAPSQPPVPSKTALPSVTPYPTPTKRATITPEPTSTGVSVTVTPFWNPGGERVVFQAGDGQELVGYYYVAPQPNSPVVVLMHQLGSNQKQAWPQSDLIPWLQNQPITDSQEAEPTRSALGMLPLMPPGVHFNVLTFDFRGHGESSGKLGNLSDSKTRQGYLLDAQAAYALARTLPHANPDKIIGLGASLGADAVVDACAEGCVGAFAISPGSWLGQDWATTANRLANARKHIRCMYSFNDGQTASACTSVTITKYYRILGYEGKKHGQDFLVPRKMETGFGDILLVFLLAASGQ